MTNIIPLRPCELSVDTKEAAEEFATAAVAPVVAWARALEERIEADGFQGRMRVHVTVRLSPALRAAMAAEGAFEIVVDWGREQ